MVKAGEGTHRNTHAQRTAIKLRCLDILAEEPTITTTHLAKRLGIQWETARRYRDEMVTRLDKIEKDVSARMNTKVSLIGGIWQKITQALK